MSTMNHLSMIFTWKNIITQTILTQLLMIALVFSAHTSSLKFTLTHRTNVYELIMFTIPFCFVNFLPTLHEHTKTCTDNPKAAILKLVRKLFQRLILTFVLLYVLTTFANNLLPAILDLPNTIVFTAYGVWCTVVFTYLSVFFYLLYVGIYALINARDEYPVEPTTLVKVVSGFLGNSRLMSPLIRKVGHELRPGWGLMMEDMIVVVFVMPCFVITMLYVVFEVKQLIKSPSHTMKKPSKQE